jgi:ribosomal protein S18 acetylase RimI-like enzyme
MIGMLIRRPQPEEHDSVRVVVQTVVDEIYGGLWAPPPLPVDEENWHSCWVAVRDAKVIGVVRTSGEWLDDLWVLRESRGYGVGQRLLAQGEAEIIARGYETMHLRVVQSNAAAIEFYRCHGWRIARAFPHERFPITMLEMFKPIREDER